MVSRVGKIVVAAAFAHAVLLLSLGTAEEAQKTYTAADIVGRYELPMLFGGTVEFSRDGICTLTVNPPPDSEKGPLVIKEKYEVRGDVIHFEEFEVDGGKSDGKKSQPQIVSITEDALVLKDTASGGKILTYRKLGAAARPDQK